MAPIYKPATKVTTRQYPFLSIVIQADPTWARGKFYDVEYEFAGRHLYANPYTRGSFNSHSNTYPVGQPYGADDPDVVAARPMFFGTPDGKGWA